MEKFLVAVAVALLFWGPDHSQVPNQDKILPCREAELDEPNQIEHLPFE